MDSSFITSRPGLQDIARIHYTTVAYMIFFCGWSMVILILSFHSILYTIMLSLNILVQKSIKRCIPFFF